MKTYIWLLQNIIIESLKLGHLNTAGNEISENFSSGFLQCFNKFFQFVLIIIALLIELSFWIGKFFSPKHSDQHFSIESTLILSTFAKKKKLSDKKCILKLFNDIQGAETWTAYICAKLKINKNSLSLPQTATCKYEEIYGKLFQLNNEVFVIFLRAKCIISAQTQNSFTVGSEYLKFLELFKC